MWEIKHRLQAMMDIFRNLSACGEIAQRMLVQANIHVDACCLLSTGEQASSSAHAEFVNHMCNCLLWKAVHSSAPNTSKHRL